MPSKTIITSRTALLAQTAPYKKGQLIYALIADNPTVKGHFRARGWDLAGQTALFDVKGTRAQLPSLVEWLATASRKADLKLDIDLHRIPHPALPLAKGPPDGPSSPIGGDINPKGFTFSKPAPNPTGDGWTVEASLRLLNVYDAPMSGISINLRLFTFHELTGSFLIPDDPGPFDFELIEDAAGGPPTLRVTPGDTAVAALAPGAFYPLSVTCQLGAQGSCRIEVETVCDQFAPQFFVSDELVLP